AERIFGEGTDTSAVSKVIPVPEGVSLRNLTWLLKDAFDDKGGQQLLGAKVFIDSAPELGGIAVRGTTAQIKQIEQTIKEFTGGASADDPKSRTIILSQGSAATLAEALEKTFRQMRKNPLTVITPARGDKKMDRAKEDKKDDGKDDRKDDKK